MNDFQINKLSEILREHFNLFHADMICRAVQDDTISVEDFKLGVLAIKSAENNSFDDEFTPQQFKNV